MNDSHRLKKKERDRIDRLERTRKRRQTGSTDRKYRIRNSLIVFRTTYLNKHSVFLVFLL
jgi:hypothetical protein